MGFFFIYLVFDEMSKNTKFKIPKFNGKGFAMYKVKIYVILVKDGCAIALKGSDAKPQGMVDGEFASKGEISQAYISLLL